VAKLETCKFFQACMEFFDHTLSPGKIPCAPKVKVVKNYRSVPRDIRSVPRSFGLVHHCQKLTHGFASKAPALKLLHIQDDRFQWIPVCQTPFERICDALIWACYRKSVILIPITMSYHWWCLEAEMS